MDFDVSTGHEQRFANLADFGVWSFADWFFGRTWDTILEDTKRLQFGFTGAIDTEQNFIEIFDQMRAERVIPASG